MAQERISVLENGKYGLPSVPALIHLANGLDIPFSELAAAGYPEAVTFRGNGEEVTSLAALGYALQQLLTIDARSVEDALNRSSDLLARVMGAGKIDAFLFSEATTASSRSARATRRWAVVNTSSDSTVNHLQTVGARSRCIRRASRITPDRLIRTPTWCQVSSTGWVSARTSRSRCVPTGR